MAEMPDVVTLTTISTDWGNDIRDRTVQRYATVAARTAAHPSPAEGDMSYLADSNTVWVFNGTAWAQLVPGPVTTANLDDLAVTTAKLDDEAVSTAKIADNAINSFKISDTLQNSMIVFAGASGSPALTTSFANGLSTSFTVPSNWNSWQFVAGATGRVDYVGSVSSVDLLLQVDGSDGIITAYNFTPDGNSQPMALTRFTTGRTSTGSVSCALRGRKTGTGSATLTGSQLWIIASRQT